MNIFRIVCLTLCFLISHSSAQSATHYIGLGRDCQIAGTLVGFNLRSAAYPFDWVVSHNFNGIIKAFKDDFEYFLDPVFLEYSTNSVKNTRYQFYFNHFFPLVGHEIMEEMHVAGVVVPNFLDYLPMVQETQNRRIQRLLGLLSTTTERVIFIRTHATPYEAGAFMRLLKHKYPQLDAYLVVVHEREDLIGDWQIPNVLNVYASHRTGFADWWTVNEWHNVFNQIKHWFNTK